MREFPGTYFNPVDDEIRDFVLDAIDSGKTSYTDINDVRLIVNPKYVKNRAEFTDQLIWTYYKAQDDKSVIGKRKAYVNQVPALQRLAKRKLREFEKLDLLDFKAIIHWLLSVAPATHCIWAWPVSESKRIAKKIEDWHVRRGAAFLNPAQAPALKPVAFQEADTLIRAATMTLSSEALGYILTTGWIKDARVWVRHNG